MQPKSAASRRRSVSSSSTRIASRSAWKASECRIEHTFDNLPETLALGLAPVKRLPRQVERGSEERPERQLELGQRAIA